MKAALHFLVILSFVFVHNKSFSQSDLGFAPIGAKWHYEIPAFLSLDPVTYVEYEVMGDTIINGKEASVIYRTHGFDVSKLPNPFFLHYDSNRVYWHNQYSNSFHLLYDFNAEAGDTWVVRLPCNTISSPSLTDSIVYTVNSVDNIKVNGTTLKRMYVNSYDIIIEKIGILQEGYPNSLFFCDGWIVDPTPGSMRCYEDSILGLFKGPDPDPCDTVYTQVGLDDDFQNNLNLHPIPADQGLRIESEKMLKEVIIQDLAGHILTRQIVESTVLNLETSDLNNGIYLISIISSSGIRQTQKVIIQH